MAETASRRRLPPPVLFAAAWIVQNLITRRHRPTAAARVSFTAMAVGSGALAVSAVAALTRAETELGPEHPERASTLVTDGPFRFSRNPIYLAFTCALVAHAVLRRSAVALAPAAGFAAVLDRTQIPAEEQALRSRFKRSYDRYADETPRWIGCGKR